MNPKSTMRYLVDLGVRMTSMKTARAERPGAEFEHRCHKR